MRPDPAVESATVGRQNPRERSNGLPAAPLLSLVCGASVLVLITLGIRLSFFNDDWAFLLQRPGLEGDSVFSPHNGQLAVGVDLTFKALVALFGIDQLPFRVVLSFAVAGVGVMVYLLVAERAGKLLGLVAAALVVFLGPASKALLFIASLGPVAALAMGLGALLAMESETPIRNLIACALLVAAVAFSGVGLAFLVGAAIAVVLLRGPADLWIPGVPLALYAVWWITVGGDATSDLSLSNLEHLPSYVIDSAASGLASVAGLNTAPTSRPEPPPAGAAGHRGGTVADAGRPSRPVAPRLRGNRADLLDRDRPQLHTRPRARSEPLPNR